MEGSLSNYNSTPLNHEDNSHSSISVNDKTINSSNSSNNFTNGLGASQISSVGFNNLKKVNTNASSISTQSTATTKTNALARLFTKNKSSSTVNQDIISPPQPISLNNENTLYFRSNNSQDTVWNYSDTDTFDSSYADDLPESIADSAKKQGSPSIFKLPKMNKGKLRFSGKPSAARPDLSVQTTGHHGLKVPKKILSSGLLDEEISSSSFKPQSNRKNSINSPVSSTFHSIFHRGHSHSQYSDNNPSISSVNDEGTVHFHQGLSANPNRTTVCLSSSSSNSYITDISFAVVYNFTDPDYSLEDFDSIGGEHYSLVDIHKKLLVPTDQFLQNKLQKNQPSELGLGIISDYNSSDEYLNKYLIDFGKSNSKFFYSLLVITKPLFLPSQQKKLANGRKHPHLSTSTEDVGNFIKDNYMNELTNSHSPTNNNANNDTENKSPGKRERLKKMTRPQPSSYISLNEMALDDGMDDYRAREISQDILTFFYGCLLTFRKDSMSTDVKQPISRRMSVPASGPGTESKLPQSEVLERNWELLTNQWSYFNMKIRYTVVNMFYPLQKYLQNASIQLFNENQNKIIQIEIENILLIAFRDIIITPVLMKRKEIYDDFKTVHQSTGQKPPAIRRNPSSASSISFSPFEHQTSRLQRQNNISSNRHHAATFSTIDVETLKLKEKSFLKKHDDKVLNELISMFGTIESYTHSDSSTEGEHLSRHALFDEAFLFLTEVK